MLHLALSPLANGRAHSASNPELHWPADRRCPFSFTVFLFINSIHFLRLFSILTSASCASYKCSTSSIDLSPCPFTSRCHPSQLVIVPTFLDSGHAYCPQQCCQSQHSHDHWLQHLHACLLRYGTNSKRQDAGPPPQSAAANPIAGTCICFGRSFVNAATAAGNSGPRKQPMNATAIEPPMNEGTSQKSS